MITYCGVKRQLKNRLRVNEKFLTTTVIDATEIDDAPTRKKPGEERRHGP